MLTILRIDATPIALRDELEAEDLACLLDLLSGAHTVEGAPVDVSVGYERPPQRKTVYPKVVADLHIPE